MGIKSKRAVDLQLLKIFNRKIRIKKINRSKFNSRYLKHLTSRTRLTITKEYLYTL